MLLILSMMRFLDLPRVFPYFWSYPWWGSWIFHVFFHVFDLIHDEFLGFSRCFCWFLILSMMSFLEFPCVFPCFWSYQWYIYIIFKIITSKIRCSSKYMLTAFHVVWSYPWWGSWIFHVFFNVCDLINDDFLGISMCFCRFLILSIIYIYNFDHKHKQNKVQ